VVEVEVGGGHSPKSVVAVCRDNTIARSVDQTLVNVVAPRAFCRRFWDESRRTRAHKTPVCVATLSVGSARKIKAFVDVLAWTRCRAFSLPTRAARALKRPCKLVFASAECVSARVKCENGTGAALCRHCCGCNTLQEYILTAQICAAQYDNDKKRV
jgi:hypothetical protein